MARDEDLERGDGRDHDEVAEGEDAWSPGEQTLLVQTCNETFVFTTPQALDLKHESGMQSNFDALCVGSRGSSVAVRFVEEAASGDSIRSLIGLDTFENENVSIGVPVRLLI